MSAIDFNANEVKPNERPVLPAGEYDGVIIESEAYTTASEKFEAVKLTIVVASGAHQNFKLYDRLNFRRSPNYNGPWSDKDQQAVTIGGGNLSALCRAVNVLTPKDTSELHMKKFRFKVNVKNDPQYGMQNNIQAYNPVSAGPVVQSAGNVAVTNSGQMETAKAGSPF